jgi:uncharacterized protein YneF (UPF0154 family)
MTLIKIPKKNKIITSIVLLVFIVIGFYLSVYKSYMYESNNDSTGFVLCYVSLLVLPMLWFEYEVISKIIKILFIAFSLLVAVFLFWLIGSTKTKYENSELKKNGVFTKAKIFDLIIVKGRRSKTEYAIFKYTFENKEFLQRVMNFDETYKIDQILNLKISSKNPEMFEIQN